MRQRSACLRGASLTNRMVISRMTAVSRMLLPRLSENFSPIPAMAPPASAPMPAPRALQYREPRGDALQRDLFFDRLVDEERLDTAGGESAAKSVDHHRSQQYPGRTRKEEHAVTDQIQNTRKQERCFYAVEIREHAAGKLGHDHGHGIQADDQRDVLNVAPRASSISERIGTMRPLAKNLRK